MPVITAPAHTLVPTIPTRRVVYEIGRFEAMRAARHPLIWLGILGSMWLMWTWVGRVAPVLERDSIYLAGSLMPLAAVTGLVTFYAALRDRSIPELSASFPVSRNQRTLGMALATVGPLIVSVGLIVAGIIYLALGSPIGRFDWWELAAGPAIITLFGVAGVFLATRLPHPIVAPMAILVVAYLEVLASPDTSFFSGIPTANFEWLAPWMPPPVYVPVGELATRPDLSHLAAMAAVIAIMVIGSIRGRRWLSLRVASAGAVALGLFVASTTVVEPFYGSSFDWIAASEDQPCESRDGADYCYYPGYEEWVDRWESVLTAVARVAPVTVDRVLQRPSFLMWGDEADADSFGSALTRQSWDRPGVRPDHAYALALSVSGTALGLPSSVQIRPYTEAEIKAATRNEPEPDIIEEAMRADGVVFYCSAIGQARAAASAWLAASALDGGKVALANSVASNGSWRWPGQVVYPFDPPAYLGSDSGELAMAMLDLPTDQVMAVIEANWDELVDPDTTLATLAMWLRLPTPITTVPLQPDIPRCE